LHEADQPRFLGTFEATAAFEPFRSMFDEDARNRRDHHREPAIADDTRMRVRAPGFYLDIEDKIITFFTILIDGNSVMLTYVPH
jgi:hypothetical protein